MFWPLNVQGPNIPHKRTKAFRCFAASKSHIVCLQETHFTARATPLFFSTFYPQVFTASAAIKQRGVLIASHRTTPFVPTSEIKDPEDRYIRNVSSKYEITVTIVSYYAPNKQPNFFFFPIFSM